MAKTLSTLTADKYQSLFNFLKQEHNLTLTVDEMDEVILEAEKVTKQIKQIDWEFVEKYISYKKFTWELKDIQKAYDDYKSGYYISFTARQVIEHAILPQLHELKP